MIGRVSSTTVARPRVAAVSRALAGRHVLLFDPSGDGTARLRRLVEGEGAMVTAVATVAEVCEVVRSVIPDVVVHRIGKGRDEGELFLPLRDGAAPVLAGLRAVAIVGRGSGDAAERALAAGYRACVAEPLHVESLVAVLSDLAARAANAPGPHPAVQHPAVGAPEPAVGPTASTPPDTGSSPADRPPAGVTPAAVPANELLEWLAATGALDGQEVGPVWLRAGEVLASPGDAVEAIYFPVDAVLSLAAPLADGSLVELSLVGSGSAFVGSGHEDRRVSLYRVTVLYGGLACRIQASALRNRAPGAMDLALAWVAAVDLLEARQRAACAALHSVPERVSRWLCAARDAVGTELPVTHETIARALGVRRAGVTTVLGELEQAGAIVRTRGRIRVLDPAGLEVLACECYGAVRAESESLRRRLLGPQRA
jgi:CRP-like cAMP-binding protein/CheY-like chemotaxis protein